MAGLVGDRDAIPELHVRQTAVGDLQKQLVAFFVPGGLDKGFVPGFAAAHGGVQGVFQCVGKQHAQIALRDGRLLRDACLHRELYPGLGGAVCKGRKDEIRRFVLAVDGHLAGLDLAAHAADVAQRLLGAAILDAACQKLHMVAQVVAVGAGALLGKAQCFDLAHGLRDLQVQAGLQLLHLDALPLHPGGAQNRAQKGCAAHKEHELHRRRVCTGQKAGVDTGDVIKEITHQRHDAKLALHGSRVAGKLPHGGGKEPDEQQQQRQGEQQLSHRLHQRMLREEQRHGQRRPAPHLTAQVGREHRHQRPDLLSAEQHQHDIQRQVGDEGVKVLGSRGTGAKVEDALQCQQPGGAARQRPALFARPADGAERRTEQDTENAYCCTVQHFRQNARGGHRTTFFPAKAYSRY